MMDPHQPEPRKNGVEQFRPVRPEKPDDEASPGSKRAKSSFSIILAGGALLLGIALLALLMFPVAGVMFGVVGMVLLLAGLAALHYITWGWWLGGVIRAEVEADEKAAEEAEARRHDKSETA